MEDILTSMRKESENLAVKLETPWESETESDNVGESSNLNGDMIHFDENPPNEMQQDAPEASEKNSCLVDVQIGSKTIENVSVRGDCLLQDVAEELAENEMVRVVYFLQEKIKKGGINCDASEAKVLVRLRSNWKWICIEDLVDDTNVTFEEVFANIPEHFKPLFSLAPKSNSKEDRHSVNSPSHSSCTGERTSEDHGAVFITNLRDFISKHKVHELSKKDSQLEKDITAHLSTTSLAHSGQDKIVILKKHLCGLHKLMTSIPSSNTSIQHPNQHDFNNINTNSNEQDKTPQHCVGVETQDSYTDQSSAESLSETSAVPLSRHRTIFDPFHEVPRLKEWFKQDPLPSKSVINSYVNELNASEFRQGKSPVPLKAVYIWFKNTRARNERKRASKSKTN